MAFVQVEIPITVASPAVDEECTFYYFVEWKLTGDVSYSSTTTSANPIVLSPLISESEYDVRVTRYCCNGLPSTVTTTTIDTTLV